ncbi:hypothetical protein OBBRIDRAFT_139517 [Obba rivulosa]|uniref:Uncharacterized protein n=1 Tax=Obba rivulosa TaxID=1052685 RepID=A0A8E2AT41_9APHY|nr:hypothetical protein OBBRIDRAFT_139517 [Obba rivulosa]
MKIIYARRRSETRDLAIPRCSKQCIRTTFKLLHPSAIGTYSWHFQKQSRSMLEPLLALVIECRLLEVSGTSLLFFHCSRVLYPLLLYPLLVHSFRR